MIKISAGITMSHCFKMDDKLAEGKGWDKLFPVEEYHHTSLDGKRYDSLYAVYSINCWESVFRTIRELYPKYMLFVDHYKGAYERNPSWFKGDGKDFYPIFFGGGNGLETID